MTARWLLPLLVTLLPACGQTLAEGPVAAAAAPGSSVDLAQTTRVTFPGEPSRRTERLVVGGHDVLVGGATYEEPGARRPYEHHGIPLRLTAVVMKFDAPAFPTLGERESAALVATIRAAFAGFGKVVDLAPVAGPGGLPSFQLSLDRPNAWSLLRRSHVRTVVRIVVGRTSLSFLAARFDPWNVLDESQGVEAFDALLASSSFADRAPEPQDDHGGASPNVDGAALETLVSLLD